MDKPCTVKGDPAKCPADSPRISRRTERAVAGVETGARNPVVEVFLQAAAEARSAHRVGRKKRVRNRAEASLGSTAWTGREAEKSYRRRVTGPHTLIGEFSR